MKYLEKQKCYWLRIVLERNNQILKSLDFWVGIPLLYCLSFFKKRSTKRPDEIQIIGIFAFAAIGDSILSSCLFNSLRKQYPEAEIIIFTSKANADIYSILSGYDELVTLPVTKPLKVFKVLKKYSLDILIDTSQWTKLSAIYSVFIQSKFKIGFETKGQYRHYGYDIVVPHSNKVHELENFRALLKPLGIYFQGSPSFKMEQIETHNLGSIGIKKYQPYIVFHPWASGTRSELREWPLDFWVELAKSLIAKDLYILISGSPQNLVDTQKLAKSIGLRDKTVILAGKLSFSQLAKVILGTKAIISVNTGIAHLADHLKVPTIVLNGPTNSVRWGVVNKRSLNIDVPKKNGGGFLNLGFEYPSHYPYIMNQITVQQVQSEIEQIMQINTGQC